MKNRLLFLGLIVLLIGIICTGCGSLTSTASATVTNNGTFGEQVITPAKDFETISLVFVEKQFQITDKGITGEAFTYQALLQEAKKLNADAIINVVIDRKTEYIKQGMSVTEQRTLYGSALAIKYTTALTESSSSELHDSVNKETSKSTSTNPILNSRGAQTRTSESVSVSNETPASPAGFLGNLLPKKK
jgi:uncharacterized protein YbjQ (UPF0145 family)